MRIDEYTKINWISFKQKNKETKYTDLKNTYIKIKQDILYKCEFYKYPVLSPIQTCSISVSLMTNEIGFYDQNLKGTVINFGCDYNTELCISGFEITKYRVAEAIVEGCTIDFIDNINMDSGNSIITYKIMPVEDIFYHMHLEDRPIQFSIKSKDGLIELIVYEPHIRYILKDSKSGKRFVGVANCLPNDKFDLMKGINIATLKAEIKQKDYKLKQLSK